MSSAWTILRGLGTFVLAFIGILIVGFIFPANFRYRRIWVIACSLVRAWSCVEGRVRKSTACFSFGSGSGNNPSSVFRGRSLKRLQIWITDALVERAAH